MKKIQVKLKGITPLLMNSPKSMIEEAMNSDMKTSTKKHDFEASAEKLAYKTDKGKLYVPAEAIKGSLIGAASWKKIGKFTAKPIIAGGVFIPEPELILDKQKYELDYRTVVIQKARVVKARPMVRDWTLDFEILYNENLIPDETIIKELLIESGQRVGILDFRPQKMGSFGMFEVEEFKVKDTKDTKNTKDTKKTKKKSKK